LGQQNPGSNQNLFTSALCKKFIDRYGIIFLIPSCVRVKNMWTFLNEFTGWIAQIYPLILRVKLTQRISQFCNKVLCGSVNNPTLQQAHPRNYQSNVLCGEIRKRKITRKFKIKYTHSRRYNTNNILRFLGISLP
jgi:hypothetical protein